MIQALILCMAAQALAEANPTTTPAPSTTDKDVCTIPEFQWHLNNRGTFCCPGVLDQQQGDESKAYCCVGAHIPGNVVITTTQTSCATTVSLFPSSDYTSKVREAATKYGVTYTTNVGAGNQTVVSTATVGVSPTSTLGGSSTVSTGGASARTTAAAALWIAGGLLLGI